MQTPPETDGVVPAVAALAAVCAYALVVGAAALVMVTAVGTVAGTPALRAGLQVGSAAAVVVTGGMACLPVLARLGLVRVEVR